MTVEKYRVVVWSKDPEVNEPFAQMILTKDQKDLVQYLCDNDCFDENLFLHISEESGNWKEFH